MANRLWPVPVEAVGVGEILKKSSVLVPDKRLVNVEWITRLDITYHTEDDTFSLEMFLVNAPMISLPFSTRSEVEDALALWRKRIELSGPSTYE